MKNSPTNHPRRRWVVKIGSSLLTNNGQGLDRVRIADWVRQMVDMQQHGIDVVLVSSGAIAAGMGRLGWTVKPKGVAMLQTAAAVGQTILVQCYEDCFAPLGKTTAQILLTHDDLSNRNRYLNARNALRTMLDLGVVPVINENDTVITDEIRVGDNDTLGALVANLVEADVLVILTDQLGLFDADPRHNPEAKLIRRAQANDPFIASVAAGAGLLGSGGMATKVKAAILAARSGTRTHICAGKENDVLLRLVQGEALGTLVEPDQEPVVAKKQWLAGHLKTRGQMVLDAGAVKALTQGGKSLLPVGVTAVSGRFHRGDAVSLVDTAGVRIAIGLSNYDVADCAKLCGAPSGNIESLIGYLAEPELVHRDNLVVVT